MDAALKPLLAYDLSEDDLKNLKEAVRLVQKDDFSAARTVIAKLRDLGAQKLATWYAYRAGAYDASPWEIAEFRESSPLWPDRNELDERVEDALFWRETNPRKVLDYFREHRPISGSGKAALGGALIAAGKADDGAALVREAWRQHMLTPAIEAKLKDVHSALLRPEDHKARLDWLFVKNRKSDLKAIDRLVPLVDKKWEKSVQAQIATIKGDKNAGTLLSKLDDDVRSDPAILLARIVWARRNDKDDETLWDLLRAAPTDSRKLINPMSWWDYRETQVRAALNAGQPKIAYSLAAGYGGNLPAEELSDAEFLAGWISLRFLDDAKTAHRHLLASAAAGGLPKHRARGSYWLGRAELALGNKRAASGRFADAAQYTHTFYGQLSRQIAEPKATQFALRPYARPTPADIQSFTRNPVLRALGAANKAGFEESCSGVSDRSCPLYHQRTGDDPALRACRTHHRAEPGRAHGQDRDEQGIPGRALRLSRRAARVQAACRLQRHGGGVDQCPHPAGERVQPYHRVERGRDGSDAASSLDREGSGPLA